MLKAIGLYWIGQHGVLDQLACHPHTEETISVQLQTFTTLERRKMNEKAMKGDFWMNRPQPRGVSRLFIVRGALIYVGVSRIMCVNTHICWNIINLLFLIST